MKHTFLSAMLLASTFSATAAPTADIAILLDTSGSMQGLINQVRDGLWKTLNSLGELQKDGQKAQVRLALYEYGSGVVSSEANFIQLLSPLTTDHTRLAQALFATEAKGSQEYSGLAIDLAHKDLKWSSEGEDFRSIVIAGNETIHQGPVEPLLSAGAALSSDIIVNTVFAGPQTNTSIGHGGGFCGGFGGFNCPPNRPTPPTPQDPTPNPIFLEWQKMARAGGGEGLNIDHNQSLPYIKSPFDEEIVKLTEEVNDTFLPFGELGAREYQRMLDLDRNIRNSGAGTYMDWGNYRGGSFGMATQSQWDLVSLAIEAEEENTEALSDTLLKLEDSQLPDSLKGKTMAEKIELVLKEVAKRKKLESQISALREKRAEFVEEELRQLNAEGEKTFSDAIKEVITKQLKDKGFVLP